MVRLTLRLAKGWLAFVLVLAGCATAPKVSLQPAVDLDHKYFFIKYDVQRRLPRFVRYSLSARDLKAGFVKRKGRDRFLADPVLVARQLPLVKPGDYQRSGFHRGHMAPAADFAWSSEAHALTFVMSNMAPQTPGLNVGAWSRLERLVRLWACGEKQVTVFTGPVFDANLPTIPSGVPIPQRFFKVVFDETPPHKVAAFLYSQEDRSVEAEDRQVPLSQVAQVTGIDFVRERLTQPVEPLRSPAGLADWKKEDCQ